MSFATRPPPGPAAANGAVNEAPAVQPALPAAADAEVGSKRKASDEGAPLPVGPETNTITTGRITLAATTVPETVAAIAGASTHAAPDPAAPDAKRLRIAAAYAARSIPSTAAGKPPPKHVTTTTTGFATRVPIVGSTVATASTEGRASIDAAAHLPHAAAEAAEDDPPSNAETNEDGEVIYCTCRQVHGNRFMLECGECTEWYVRSSICSKYPRPAYLPRGVSAPVLCLFTLYARE